MVRSLKDKLIDLIDDLLREADIVTETWSEDCGWYAELERPHIEAAITRELPELDLLMKEYDERRS